MRVHTRRNAVVVELAPRCGPEEVDVLEQKLRLIAPIEVIVVDCAGARDVDDSAVGRLAQALARIALTVEFRGLSMHQRRLLRYLGHGERGGTLDREQPAIVQPEVNHAAAHGVAFALARGRPGAPDVGYDGAGE